MEVETQTLISLSSEISHKGSWPTTTDYQISLPYDTPLGITRDADASLGVNNSHKLVAHIQTIKKKCSKKNEIYWSKASIPQLR